jgi:hypothetical protein
VQDGVLQPGVLLYLLMERFDMPLLDYLDRYIHTGKARFVNVEEVMRWVRKVGGGGGMQVWVKAL